MSYLVEKADGSTEYFRPEKLRRSLRRAGAKNDEIQKIITAVQHRLFAGIRTQEIYRFAFEQLHQTQIGVATRYSLRRALFGLGPTGFPFERFLARLFASDGYQTKTGLILSGRCVEHEIDLACYKQQHSFVAEAKFHARPGIKTDLQVAMYSYARLLDLKMVKICAEDFCGINEFWLITNTKFTTQVEKYATCVGINLLSWEYPKRNNLHDRIQRAGIYPITTMTSLSSTQLSLLIANDIILCQDLLDKQHILQKLHLNPLKHNAILAEARQIIGHRK